MAGCAPFAALALRGAARQPGRPGPRPLPAAPRTRARRHGGRGGVPAGQLPSHPPAGLAGDTAVRDRRALLSRARSARPGHRRGRRPPQGRRARAYGRRGAAAGGCGPGPASDGTAAAARGVAGDGSAGAAGRGGRGPAALRPGAAVDGLACGQRTAVPRRAAVAGERAGGASAAGARGRGRRRKRGLR
ncbi:hypothetical protein ACRAWF_38830 [Streptomyces sp. L7]